MTTNTLHTTAARRASPRGGQAWYHVRRCLEMVAAMLTGMVALVPIERLVWPELTARADAGVVVLATNMSIGLAAWMRVRDHRWRDTVVTSAVIHLPFLALLVSFWSGAIGEYAVLSWGPLLTVPAMALALLLRPAEDVR